MLNNLIFARHQQFKAVYHRTLHGPTTTASYRTTHNSIALASFLECSPPDLRRDQSIDIVLSPNSVALVNTNNDQIESDSLQCIASETSYEDEPHQERTIIWTTLQRILISVDCMCINDE